MKFLLPQKLNFKKDHTFFYIYPNHCSRQFIRIAKDLDLIFNITYTWSNGHQTIEKYEILENDFKFIFKCFRSKIEKKRKKFYSRPALEQLILLLKYIFKRNMKAKQVRKFSARQKAYEDKNQFLRLALNISKNIKNHHFSFGWQEDPGTINFEYVYYFQFKNKQVSFHSDKLYLDVPEFEGQWIGHPNETFPFDLRVIKKYL
jgi:hypothetical protein